MGELELSNPKTARGHWRGRHLRHESASKSRRTTSIFVTLNNTSQIDPDTILGQWTYAHQFGPIHCRSNLGSRINSGSRIVVAGAWCCNGFHEDGVVSGERGSSCAKNAGYLCLRFRVCSRCRSRIDMARQALAKRASVSVSHRNGLT